MKTPHFTWVKTHLHFNLSNWHVKLYLRLQWDFKNIFSDCQSARFEFKKTKHWLSNFTYLHVSSSLVHPYNCRQANWEIRIISWSTHDGKFPIVRRGPPFNECFVPIAFFALSQEHAFSRHGTMVSFSCQGTLIPVSSRHVSLLFNTHNCRGFCLSDRNLALWKMCASCA